MACTVPPSKQHVGLGHVLVSRKIPLGSLSKRVQYRIGTCGGSWRPKETPIGGIGVGVPLGHVFPCLRPGQCRRDTRTSDVHVYATNDKSERSGATETFKQLRQAVLSSLDIVSDSQISGEWSHVAEHGSAWEHNVPENPGSSMAVGKAMFEVSVWCWVACFVVGKCNLRVDSKECVMFVLMEVSICVGSSDR